MNEYYRAILQWDYLKTLKAMETCPEDEREMYAFHLEKMRELFASFGYAFIQPTTTVH